MILKVIFEYSRQNNDGYYDEDNPDADYPREVFYQPTWSTYILTKEIDSTKLQEAFDMEDGDEDFSRHIVYIVDKDDKIIYRATNEEHSRNKEHMIDYYSQEVEE